MANEAADRRHLAQRAAHEHVRGRAHPSRPGVERPVLRIAEDRDRVARVRIDDRAAAPHAGRGRAARRRPACGRRAAPAPACPPASMPDAPSTTWAAVTTSCGRATQPEPSTPTPHGGGGDANDARANPPHRGRGERPRVGRRRRRRRPGDRRERVDARERAQDVARRHDRVQPLEDQRAADLVAHLRLVGQLQQDGARDPHEGEPERSARRRSRRSNRACAAAGSRRGSRARTSRRSRRRSAAAPRRRARPRARRAACTGELAPLCRKCGASRAPIIAPSDEPAERERRRDQAALEAGERREGGDRKRDPVGAGSPGHVSRPSGQSSEACADRVTATLAPEPGA